MKRKTEILILILIISQIHQNILAQTPEKREFRAAWIATVANIDWPSLPGLSSDRQKAEYRALLDHLKYAGMNAVIVQVRPAADAMYPSELEPWSEWLMGARGKAPEPYYDPLMYMIEEAHDRGMEFHAWFNPYRAIFKVDPTFNDSTHLTLRKPEWFVQYGEKMYFDPGIPEVRDFVTNVIRDVVKRYDVDAIHFDDYFYPYRIAGVEFPDSLSFAQYGSQYKSNQKDDWRRENVNTIIRMLHESIKSEKEYVKFGISPFGVWRNKVKDSRGSDTQAGQTNYDDLFADVLLWMKEGWLDYLVPQIYWPIGFNLADYQVLVDWWNDHSYGRHIYIGEGAYRINADSPTEAWQNPSEMPDHLRLSRKYDNLLGQAYFSAKSLVGNPLGFTDTLHNKLYQYPALVPVMDWIDSEPPLSPRSLRVRNTHNGIRLDWIEDNPVKPSYYVIYRYEKRRDVGKLDPEFIVAIDRYDDHFYLDQQVRDNKRYRYLVTSLDRLWNESKPSDPVEIKHDPVGKDGGFWFF